MSQRSFTKFWTVSVSAAVIFAGCHTQQLSTKKCFTLQPGDLLFQDLDGGPLCDAIEKVTSGYEGANLSHVGIATKLEDGRFVVIEAIASGVDTVPVQQFLKRLLRLLIILQRLQCRALDDRYVVAGKLVLVEKESGEGSHNP